MESFRNPNYTKPVISKHCNDLKKDWYVFFEFVHEGKIYKMKKREGVNRFKTVRSRLNAIKALQLTIEGYLEDGWNPIVDPHRKQIQQSAFLRFYNPKKDKPISKKQKQAFEYYYNKR